MALQENLFQFTTGVIFLQGSFLFMFNMQKNDPWVIFLPNKPIILQLDGHYSA
jgi:hypothetical protein